MFMGSVPDLNFLSLMEMEVTSF